jgi:hypothetical protein
VGVSDGLSNTEVAGRLGISVRTIEKHRENILDSLGPHNIAGLVRFAVSEGLIRFLSLARSRKSMHRPANRSLILGGGALRKLYPADTFGFQPWQSLGLESQHKTLRKPLRDFRPDQDATIRLEASTKRFALDDHRKKCSNRWRVDPKDSVEQVGKPWDISAASHAGSGLAPEVERQRYSG